MILLRYFCCGLLLVIATRAQAEEAPTSEQAFRLVCDQSMPFFLQRQPEQAIDVLKVVHDADQQKNLDKSPRLFRTIFEAAKSIHGEPMGWEYVGSRSYNSVLTQFIYVCRYENHPLFFEMTGLRTGDDWKMHGFHFHDDLPKALEDFPVDSETPEDTDCARQREQVIQCLVETDYATILSQFPQPIIAAKPGTENYLRSVTLDAAGLGPLQRHELLYSKTVGDAVFEFAYVLRFDDQSRFLRLFYYRTEDEWKLLNLQYDKDMNRLGSIPIRPQLPVRQAARP